VVTFSETLGSLGEGLMRSLDKRMFTACRHKELETRAGRSEDKDRIACNVAVQLETSTRYKRPFDDNWDRVAISSDGSLQGPASQACLAS